MGGSHPGLRWRIAGRLAICLPTLSWVWSPNGRWLAWTVIPPHDIDGLVQAATWQTHRLHLPPDARLVGWSDRDAGGLW